MIWELLSPKKTQTKLAMLTKNTAHTLAGFDLTAHNFEGKCDDTIRRRCQCTQNDNKQLSWSAFFDEKSIPFHKRFPRSSKIWSPLLT
jgi:hypothetical protein